MRVKAGTLASGVLISGASSGPIFLLSILICAVGTEFPRPSEMAATAVLLLFSLLYATIVGMIIGTAISGLGGLFMAWLGRRIEWTREGIVWAFAGTCIALLFIVLTGADAVLAIPLLVTSTVCGWLTGRWIIWES